jgi:hypothetical protein
MLNRQAGVSNIPSFNSVQGPSVAEIKTVEVQKDSSALQTPNTETRKRPAQRSDEQSSEETDEEEKRLA